MGVRSSWRERAEEHGLDEDSYGSWIGLATVLRGMGEISDDEWEEISKDWLPSGSDSGEEAGCGSADSGYRTAEDAADPAAPEVPPPRCGCMNGEAQCLELSSPGATPPRCRHCAVPICGVCQCDCFSCWDSEPAAGACLPDGTETPPLQALAGAGGAEGGGAPPPFLPQTEGGDDGEHPDEEPRRPCGPKKVDTNNLAAWLHEQHAIWEQCNCTCGGERCLQVMRRLHLRQGKCVACSQGDPMVCTCECSSCTKMNGSSMAASYADTPAGDNAAGAAGAAKPAPEELLRNPPGAAPASTGAATHTGYMDTPAGDDAAGTAAARPRPGTRSGPSGVVALVVGACLVAGASADPRTGAAWQRTYGLASAPSGLSRRRGSFALPVVECDVGCAALSSVEVLPGGRPPASEAPGLPGLLRRDLDASHGADVGVLPSNPRAPAVTGIKARGLSAAGLRDDEAEEVCALMQSSAGAAASQLSLRDIYNLLLDREVARSLHQFAEGDRIRDYLSRFGVSIDDETRRWRSRDGRRGRRPNADDLRWDAAAAQEPVLRADRIAVALVAAATEGDWTTDRFVWNLLRDRELARRAYSYREADRIRSYLQELGFEVDDQTCTWSSADGRTGRRPNSSDHY